MAQDSRYLALASGPERVDALWRKAKTLAGSNKGALDLLGMMAAVEGSRLNHPFNTGLHVDGPLSPNDKAGHFFAHAMWYYYDRTRPFGIAEFYSIAWECVGEMRSWLGWGSGFNWDDIWANQLGWEFGRRLFTARCDPEFEISPSEVLRSAVRYRPESAGR